MLVSVGYDNRIHTLPGSPVEQQDFELRGDRIVDALGAEQLACRNGRVFHGAKELARFGAGWFGFETSTATVAPDGRMKWNRVGDDPADSMRYVGLRAGDMCTAALLYHVIAARVR